MTDKLDIVGIGNAMVDAIIPSNKDEVEKNNLNRDSMNLIDEDLKNSLHNNYSIKEMAGGGSLGGIGLEMARSSRHMSKAACESGNNRSMALWWSCTSGVSLVPR